MALSLDHLDALVGYDPDTHSVKGLPSMMQPTEENERRNSNLFTLAQVAGAGRENPTLSAGIPSMSAAAPQVRTPSDLSLNSFTGRPNADALSGIAPMGASIPDLAKPKTTWQKIEHGLNVAGNVAGNLVAPGVMAMTPGTELHKEFERAQNSKLAGQQADTELKQAEAKGWQPMTVSGPNGETLEVPARNAAALEGAGWRVLGSERNADLRADTTKDVAGKKIESQEGIAAAANASHEKIAAEKAPKTLTMLDKEGGKPYSYEWDPTKTYTGDDGRGHWKKVGPAQPNASAIGLVGSYQPRLDENGQTVGFYNTKNPGQQLDSQGKPLAAGETLGGTTSAGARLANTRSNQFNTQYVNPANQAEQQYQRATEAVDHYNNDPKTGAAAMVLFAQHLGTTLGGIKGAAIGEGAQKMHQDAIGLEDRAKRYIDYLQTGQPLSANQVHDFYDLIKQTRQLQWETTAREAARRKMPIDFLPQDISVRMTSPDGRETEEVPASHVPEFVSKGGKIGY